MGKCKKKAIQADLDIFKHIPASGIIRYNQELFRPTSALIRTLYNNGIFRILVYLEPWHIKTRRIFGTLTYSEPDIRNLPNINDRAACENN